ncbi:hypothetical protein [Paraburkholderia sp. DHOC27]|uniref:hypothetical protein n=1 Tax=Paraburkholderia sp. DHOC27 TaxID=2303330 RepID=UPI000E3CC8CB|nr:hypothetical protein [Paraburkholderia sp. DHOC27]RFU48358.1 hypothetical protein D0B32_00470 [Paraburkholderia sp. DHOC27]
MANTISSQLSATVLSATNAGTQSGTVTRAGGDVEQAVVEQASVSLDAKLGSATANTAAGQLALTLAQMLQSTTTVDPTTGYREMTDGANQQLTSALSAFLQANGFSAQQAAASVSGLAGQLAAGGDINLSAAFQDTTTASASSAEVYAGQSSLTSAVAVSERSGSVSIGLDLETGQLSVSLTEQSGSTYGLLAANMGGDGQGAPSVDSAAYVAGAPNGLNGADTSSADSPLSETMAYSYVMSQQASSFDAQGSVEAMSTASGNTAVEYDSQRGSENAASNSSGNANYNLFDWLNANSKHPRLYGDADTQDALKRMSQAASQTNEGASTGGVAQTAATLQSVSVGFSQVLSVQQLDATGHGTTIFRRPDGTIASMMSQPLHVSA